jgi:hypothetical protein
MRRTVLGLVAGLLVAAPSVTYLVACGGSPDGSSRPPVQQLAEGLNVLDAKDSTWGMDAAYVKAGHVVYFSSRVGPMKPEAYRLTWPDDPPNEMDARYVDEKGETFILRIGGDTLVDPTWAADLKAGHAANAKGDPTLRATSFQMATEMGDAMQAELGKSVPAEFAHHVLHAATLGHVEFPKVTTADLEARAREMSTKTAYSTDGDWNYYYVQQYSGTVIWVPFYPSGCSQLPSPMGGCGGQDESWHTSERLWNDRWNNGNQYWSMYEDACNHGRCPWNGLTYATARWANSGWQWSNQVDFVYAESVNQDQTGGGYISGACTTGYSWNSGGGSHLCNSDAAYEIWQIDNATTSNGTYWPWSTNTWNYAYTSYYSFSCTTNDSTARYACDGANVYRDWLPPCPF